MAHQVFNVDANEQGHGKGHVRNLDPRGRIVAVAVFAVAVVAMHQLLALGFALAFSFLMMLEAGLPPLRTMKRVAAMDGFIIFMLLILPFTMPGDEIFSIWGFSASQQGLDHAIRIGLKANAIVLLTMTLLGTLEPVSLGHALYRLKVPENLVLLLLFTVRYIDVIHEEYQSLRKAMRVRCFQSKANMHSYRSFGYLIGMMLVRSVERSERILQAMKCRGFSGRLEILDTLKFQPKDALFLVLMLVILAGLFSVEFGYVAVY